MRYLILIVAVSSLLHFSSQAARYDDRTVALVEDAPLVDLHPDKIELLSLGFPELYHQFLNFWSIQFLADPALGRESPGHVESVLRKMALHKPQIENFYLLACYSFLKDFDDSDRCISMLLLGMHAMPGSWSIPLLAGVTQQMAVGDKRAAALFYQIAGEKADAPVHIAKAAGKLMAQAGGPDGPLEEILDEAERMPGGHQLRHYLEEKQRSLSAAPAAQPARTTP